MSVLTDRVCEFTKSAGPRLVSMEQALQAIKISNTPGDVVEVGVWRAGNIMLTRLIVPDRTCWLYDTFDGMTEPDPVLDVKYHGEPSRAIDKYNAKKAGGKKWNAWPLDGVKQGFIDNDISTDRMHFVVGPVEKTLNEIIPTQIAILRLDVDWYVPTKCSLEKLYPLLSSGGFLIVDDYGHWSGCRKAVDEYFGENVPPWIDSDYSCRVFQRT